MPRLANRPLLSSEEKENTASIFAGLLRVLGSAKVATAVGALTTSYFAIRSATGDLPPTQKAALWIAFQAGVSWAVREIIVAWREEDVATTKASVPTAPAQPAVQSADGNIVNEQAAVVPDPQPAVLATSPMPQFIVGTPGSTLGPTAVPSVTSAPRPQRLQRQG